MVVKLSKSAVWVIGARNQPNGMELAVERLGSAIRLGVFPVDTKLPAERELASIIGVSRATLREAIRLLAAQGTLEAHRGRGGGTFVVRAPRPPSITEVAAELATRGTSLTEILDQRWAVETALAELAARRATRSQIDELKALLPLMESAHEETGTYRRHDIEFHLLLGEAARSTRLGKLLAESHRELAGLMTAVPHSAEIRRHSSDQHRRLVRALERGRPDEARRVMAEHLEATASFLVGLVGVEEPSPDETPPVVEDEPPVPAAR